MTKLSFVSLILFFLVLSVTPSMVSAKKRVKGLDGLHFDVELHAVSKWRTEWESVAVQFLDLLYKLREVTQRTGLELSIDMNADLDGPQCPSGTGCILTYRQKTAPLSVHIIDACDWVTLMVYFRDTAKMIEHGKDEVEYSKIVNKPVVLGVNLEATPPAIASETLADEGIPYMEQCFAEMYNKFVATDGANARFAIHHYGYWRNFESTVKPIPCNRSTTRDTYWWCDKIDLCDIYELESRTKLIQWCSAHAVSRIYIDAPAIVKLTPGEWDQSLLVNLTSDLADAGIRTHLLFGNHEWALSKNHDKPVGYATAVEAMVNFFGTDENALPIGFDAVPPCGGSFVRDVPSDDSTSGASSKSNSLLGSFLWLLFSSIVLCK